MPNIQEHTGPIKTVIAPLSYILMFYIKNLTMDKMHMHVGALFCLFVRFDSVRPINNLSVKQGRVFLGWTSTKLG